MNNLVLFAGAAAFNQMVSFLEGIKPLIRIMEFGLLSIFLLHIYNTISLYFSNKKAKAKMNTSVSTKTSSVNSRNMIISGTIILLFFIVHLRYIWYSYQAHLFFDSETYYDVILRNQLGYLGHTPTAIFYIIAILFIGSHLKHGFQSALKTFGLLENSNAKVFINYRLSFWALSRQPLLLLFQYSLKLFNSLIKLSTLFFFVYILLFILYFFICILVHETKKQ